MGNGVPGRIDSQPCTADGALRALNPATPAKEPPGLGRDPGPPAFAIFDELLAGPPLNTVRDDKLTYRLSGFSLLLS